VTTRPRPARSSGSIARVTSTVPNTLTSKTSRHACAPSVSNGAIAAIPALLTRPCSRPSVAAAIRPTALAIAVSLVTSSRTGSERDESASRITASSASERTPAKTVQPRASRATAVA